MRLNAIENASQSIGNFSFERILFLKDGEVYVGEAEIGSGYRHNNI